MHSAILKMRKLAKCAEHIYCMYYVCVFNASSCFITCHDHAVVSIAGYGLDVFLYIALGVEQFVKYFL